MAQTDRIKIMVQTDGIKNGTDGQIKNMVQTDRIKNGTDRQN